MRLQPPKILGRQHSCRSGSRENQNNALGNTSFLHLERWHYGMLFSAASRFNCISSARHEDAEGMMLRHCKTQELTTQITFVCVHVGPCPGRQSLTSGANRCGEDQRVAKVLRSYVCITPHISGYLIATGPTHHGRSSCLADVTNTPASLHAFARRTRMDSVHWAAGCGTVSCVRLAQDQHANQATPGAWNTCAGPPHYAGVGAYRALDHW